MRKGVAGDRAQKAVLEFEGDGEIYPARLALGREAPMAFQLTERTFGLSHIDRARCRVQHDATGVAFAKSTEAYQHFRTQRIAILDALARSDPHADAPGKKFGVFFDVRNNRIHVIG